MAVWLAKGGLAARPLAHGGKDVYAFPVPLKVYDEVVTVLPKAIASERLGNEKRLDALRPPRSVAVRVGGAP